jgi:hypothetical protein
MNQNTSSNDKQVGGAESRTAEQGGRTAENPAPAIPILDDGDTEEQPTAEPADDKPYRMRKPPPGEDERDVHEIPAPLPPLGH